MTIQEIPDHLGEIKNWPMCRSDKDYHTVKSVLQALFDLMQSTLCESRKVYQEKVANEEKCHREAVEEITSKYLTAPNQQADNEYEREVRSLADRWKQIRVDSAKALDAFNNMKLRDQSLSDKLYIIRSGEAHQRAVRRFIDSRAGLNGSKSSVQGDINAAEKKLSELCNAKKTLNQRRCNSQLRAANEEHEAKLSRMESEYQNETERIINQFQNLITQKFDNKAFDNAFAFARQSLRSAVNYSYSKSRPPFLYLGNRVIVLRADGESYEPGVVRLVQNLNCDSIQLTDNNTAITITLPYCRTAEEGYSVCLQTQFVNSQKNTDILKAYVLKILMNFPAGQTRPLFIDPDGTTVFSDFQGLGEESKVKYVTRSWQNSDDIERELRKLADEKSNLNVSYGDDTESRLSKEPLFFVACRNFPRNFTDNAVRHLSDVMMAGSKNGFFGFILENTAIQETEHLNQTELLTIRAHSLCICEDAGNYSVDDGSGKDLFFFDTMEDATRSLYDIRAQIFHGAKKYEPPEEKFEYLFSKDLTNVDKIDVSDVNTWFKGDASQKFEVPIGISGATSVQKFAIEGTRQHALISGVTGSGKSTLLRTFIVASMIRYSPDQVNFYLIDFKEGVEFKPFGKYKLPWIKVLALNTERIFALNMLKELEREFKRRAAEMGRADVRDAGGKFPRTFLIFDEVQELLRENDDITKECVSILSTLVSEGRAMHIHVILASQNFSKCNGIDEIKTNMVTRIALKGSPESAAVIMGSDFNIDQLESGYSGYAAINTASGETGHTSFFRAGRIKDELEEILSDLALATSNSATEPRILSTQASFDRYNRFNKLICNNEVVKSDSPQAYEIIIGDDFNVRRRKFFTLSPSDGDNVIMYGEEEKTARSVFSFIMLSVLLGKLAEGNRPDNELIRLIDLSFDEYDEDDRYFEHFAGYFPHQIHRCGLAKSVEMIEDTYTLLTERMNQPEAASSERIFLCIFGADRIDALVHGEDYTDDGTLSLKAKLTQIIEKGPRYAINTVAWANSYRGLTGIFSPTVLSNAMKKRIFFGTNEEEARSFINLNSLPESGKNTLYFRDMNNPGSVCMRAYEIPEEKWLATIGKAYREYIQKNKKED